MAKVQRYFLVHFIVLHKSKLTFCQALPEYDLKRWDLKSKYVFDLNFESHDFESAISNHNRTCWSRVSFLVCKKGVKSSKTKIKAQLGAEREISRDYDMTCQETNYLRVDADSELWYTPVGWLKSRRSDWPFLYIAQSYVIVYGGSGFQV